MRMERRIRHGKRMSSYEEAVMDVMARVEESERYLQRYRNSDHAVIVVENGEEEHYPSFAIGKKKKEEAVQSIESIWQEEEDDWVLCEKTGRNTVKLTVWEWMEARRKGSSMCSCCLPLFSTNLHRMDGYECAQLSDSEDNEKRMHSCTCIEIRSLGHKRRDVQVSE